MKSPERLLRLLLVVCSVSLPASIVLTGYFLFQYQEIVNLKARLLSENELQNRLLSAQPLEESVMPHIVKDIGFVLNPHMKRSSFMAHIDDAYPINSLGLRGPEIKSKEDGVIRILIVGDSIVFGWKLEEKDRLSSILNRYASGINSTTRKLEFYTIAMPGWNVKSERAFLESHLRLLDPDLILWFTISNDIEDVPGAIPPGNIANWASPQARDYSPFVGLSPLQKNSGSFMPLIADRLRNNIELILTFRSKYGIPVILFSSRRLLDQKQALLFEGQRLFIPGKYMGDKRWSLSVSDAHPTPWANYIMSVGILSKLVRSGFIPKMEFSPEETAIARDFEAVEARVLKKGYTKTDFSTALAQIPTEYRPDDLSSRESVLYGVSAGGVMTKAGALFLRDPAHSSHIIIRIESPINVNKYPGSAMFTVRNRKYEDTHTIARIDAKHVDIRLEIPIENLGSRVYEVSWLYDFLLCRNPNSCSVGTLEYAKFEQ